MNTGVSSLQGVQEIHGNVCDHCQPEGHLSASRCHAAQVSSQVQYDTREFLEPMHLLPIVQLINLFQSGS